VDDDESVCRALSRLLRCVGLEARGFGSAEVFLRSLVNGHTLQMPDCALIDMHMPGMNGLALHTELLRRGNRFPVIFMTAHDVDHLRAQALRQGAIAYLTKPLTECALLEAIGVVLTPAADVGHQEPASVLLPAATSATDRV
jgi:FixJ family two-component response regulator